MEDIKGTVETSVVPVQKLSVEDKLALDLAKEKVQRTALEAQHTELQYRYQVLSLYFRYGLSEQDAINDKGEIIRGGAQQG